jgi:hypothetical protein
MAFLTSQMDVLSRVNLAEGLGAAVDTCACKLINLL